MSTAILATDLATPLEGSLRTQWTAGKMRLLVDALDRTPVSLIVDTVSGHALVNVRLLGVDNRPAGATVTIQHGTGTCVAYPLRNLGMTVIPLTDPPGQPALHVALARMMDESRAAIRAATLDRPHRGPGRWDTCPVADGVLVSWKPETIEDGDVPYALVVGYDRLEVPA